MNSNYFQVRLSGGRGHSCWFSLGSLAFSGGRALMDQLRNQVPSLRGEPLKLWGCGGGGVSGQVCESRLGERSQVPVTQENWWWGWYGEMLS